MVKSTLEFIKMIFKQLNAQGKHLGLYVGGCSKAAYVLRANLDISTCTPCVL